ncbi:hypothetical protein D3C79_1026810 [compost metagenome]
MVAADTADLQVAAVGGLDHAAGEALGGLGHGIGLIGQQQATGQLDPANPTITRIDDAPQPRAGRGAR